MDGLGNRAESGLTTSDSQSMVLDATGSDTKKTLKQQGSEQQTE